MKVKRGLSWLSLFVLVFSSHLFAAEPHVYKSIREALREPERVVHLELRKDDLTEIPGEIWQFTNLEILDLGKNDIQSVPDSIQKLTHLRVLILEKNELSHFPNALLNLPNLEELYLSGNDIRHLPENIDTLQKLTILDMWSTRLEDLPEGIKRLPNLRRLDLRQSYMSQQQFDREYTGWLNGVEVLLTYGCDCGEPNH